MKRNDFLKACAAGACGCCSIGFLSPFFAQSKQSETEKSTQQEDNLLKQQLNFVRKRFAYLISIMSEDMDKNTLDKILHKLGHDCAQAYNPLFQEFHDNLDGFLDRIKTCWVEKIEYDEDTDSLLVIGKVRPCVCPLVKENTTPGDFCACTVGWNQYAFSTVLGKPVTVELEESILRGGTRCTHRIIGIKG